MSEIKSARERHATLVNRIAKHEAEIEDLRAEVDKLEVFLQLAEELFGGETEAPAPPQTAVAAEQPTAAPAPQRPVDMAGPKVIQKEDLIQPGAATQAAAPTAEAPRVMPARQQRPE
ncbi:MAG: hypothetical protein AAF222_11450 [Pseudomonadota bacterium]